MSEVVTNWETIIEDVKWLPYQQNMMVSKEAVIHPEILGFPYNWGAYRFPIADGKVIDIKESDDYYHIHWDKYNPDTHLIEHALEDAPLEWLFTTAGIGALISPDGKRREGAIKGFGFGLLLCFLKAQANQQEGACN